VVVGETLKSYLSDSIAGLVHEKSVEILTEVGFCVPERNALDRLEAVGFPVDGESHMVRVTSELLEAALGSLPRGVKLYDRAGEEPAPFERGPCFMGAGTPVNVFDLETGARRSATRQDVRHLVTLQDALPQVDIVRPTVTATDQGECSDLVEIAELLRCTGKPVVHRTLSAERVDAAVEMLAAVAGGEDRFRARPNFATLYCPISPGYFTPENVRCMLRWAEHGVPITLLSMAMGGASAPATLLGELVVINVDILAWMVALQILYPGVPLLYGSVSAVDDQRRGGDDGPPLWDVVDVRRAFGRCQATGRPGGVREGGHRRAVAAGGSRHHLRGRRHRRWLDHILLADGH
jgi:trimethylamine--corrinoid protein Co-methyltransferase